MKIKNIINHCKKKILAEQKKDGHWVYELEADTTIPSEYILMNHFLGIKEEILEKKLAIYIKKKQNYDGGWPLFWNGESNISTSVKAYYALKLAGEKKSSKYMVKAKKMDRRLVEIRKALANGTATQKMVDDYNTAVSQIAGDINKDVPKGGKKLQPFLIKMGGDPRLTVSNFKQLAKQNPLAVQDMLNVAKNQGWSGVIPSDVLSIYDLQDPDKVKSSITDTIHNVFGTKSKELIKGR